MWIFVMMEKMDMKKAVQTNYDIILLDVMLPNLNGMEVCRRLRTKKNTPIIMLTAKGDITDKVNGLDLGADDYLTKPFEIEELDARVKVLLRKNEKGKEVTEEAIERPDFVLEKNSRILKNSVGNKKVKLSGKEYTLLKVLREDAEILSELFNSEEK